ncbi:MAG: MFS transporter [Erythrobacter sp.]
MSTITRGQIPGLLGVMIASFVVPLTIAFNIGVMIEEFSAKPSEAGLVATVDGVVAAISALICSRLIARYTARQFFLVGLTICATGHAMSAFSPSLNWLMAFQAYAGVGVGMVLSVVMATAARTAKPEMTIGLINASLGAFIIFLGFVMPAVIGSAGLKGAYLTYAALACLGILSAFFGPNDKAPDPKATGADNPEGVKLLSGKLRIIVLVSLLGYGIFFAAQSGMAAFVQPLSEASGLSLKEFGQVFAVGGFLTIVGPLIAGWVGARFGATLPLIVLVSGLCVTVFGLAILTSPLSYYIAAPLFTMLPGLLTPSFLGALSYIDKTGRAMGMQPAYATLGGSMGAIISGNVLEGWGFDGLGWYSIVVFVIAAALMAFATLSADRGRRPADPDLQASPA